MEGLSFHVGSQCTNFANYVQALNLMAGIFHEAWERGYPQVKILDIGGGFPVPYDNQVQPFRALAKLLNTELDRLFPNDMEILAEPGRFLVATAGTLVATVVGKAVRDGKQCYYIDDGVYHTFSGIIFDHIPYHIKAFKGGSGRSPPSSGPPAMRSTRLRWPRNCPIWNWATWSTARTSARTVTPRRPTSTDSRRRPWSTSTGEQVLGYQGWTPPPAHP